MSRALDVRCRLTARTVVVSTNRAGLHARAAMLIAQVARRHAVKVETVKDHQRVEAKDVLQILSLGAAPGTQLVLEASRPRAEEALAAVAQLFDNNFDVP